MADSINGWQPPLIYDASIDQKRIATQADIDRMEGQLRILLRFFEATRRESEIVQSAAKVLLNRDG
jgi:hypothetical protein